jgi:uncharacterized protein
MMSFYTPNQRDLQRRFETEPLADALQATIVSESIDPDQHKPFIESRDFFFLSTVNANGEPTVSYKGGPVGVVSVVEPRLLVFPSYDGNGMFLSMGNTAATSKIGLLFIDFETPQRLRVQATATVHETDPLMTQFPGAQLLVRAHVDQVFVNCARYIHKHSRVDSSRYVPDQSGSAPLPAWKRIDFVQGVLPPKDLGRAEENGGLITIDEYAAKLAAGES